MSFNLKYESGHKKRFSNSLKLMERFVPSKEMKILDLGAANPLSTLMKENGFKVENTPDGLDLDTSSEWLKNETSDILTAFEIFEHLTNPFQILVQTSAKRLITTVPLNLWFAEAYRNKTDSWDRHYHEFEDWQFDMLLQRTGWKIIHAEKWKVYDNKIGIRPILRRFYPRIYAVVADRI
jgi:hypothetical protein